MFKQYKRFKHILEYILFYTIYKITNLINDKFYTGKTSPTKGIPHTEEAKQKIKLAIVDKQKGNKNSQFGTIWITNGTINKKIKKDIEVIPNGWYKGRKCI